MKKNLKVGDKVRINLSAKYDGPCYIDDRMRLYDTREAEIVSITDSTTDGSNRYRLDVDGESFFYVDEWLEPISKSIVIPINDWKKIYDIACSEWKKKLYAMVEPFADTVTIDDEFAESMIKASNPTQLAMVMGVLSSAGYKAKKQDVYFDFGDEYKADWKVSGNPIYIRKGFASDGMESKEIGLNTDEFDVIVVQDGFEITLTSGSYLKFKKK